MNDSQSLFHTRWNCKYHIVVAPKFRKQTIYIKLKEDTGKIFRLSDNGFCFACSCNFLLISWIYLVIFLDQFDNI